MSDESGDKTEAPTPHRLEKAREEGQIPRSRELTSLLILLVGVSVIWFGGVSLARRLSGMLSAGLHFDHSIINDPNLILGQIILLIREAMLALLPLRRRPSLTSFWLASTLPRRSPSSRLSVRSCRAWA